MKFEMRQWHNVTLPEEFVPAMFLLIFQQRDQGRAGPMTLDFQGDI